MSEKGNVLQLRFDLCDLSFELSGLRVEVRDGGL